MTEGEVLLTREQVAELLRLKVQTLAAWAVRNRHLPVVKCGRSVRYRRADVEAFIAGNTSPVSSAK